MPAWGPYLRERFQAAPMLIMGLLMATIGSGAVAQANGGPIRFWPVIPLGSLAILGVFFVLRVLDEHKDFDRDREAHPDRVLSRGLITLPDLARVGWVVAGLCIALAAYLGLHALIWMGAALTFAVLMRYEFFVADWLRDHMVIYAITHNPVVALLCMVPVAAAAGATLFTSAVGSWLLVASFTTLALEVGRKFRPPADEKPAQDTYTQALGIPMAVGLHIVMLGLVVLAATLAVGRGTPWLWAVDFAAAGAAGAALSFAKSPSRAAQKGLEATTALLVLGTQLGLAIHVIRLYGWSWT